MFLAHFPDFYVTNYTKSHRKSISRINYLFLELYPAVIPIFVIVRSSQKQGIFPSTCLPAVQG